ncbi:hypothetical protein V8C86DRAFT_1269196 [Haematococcus lacustris]
MLHMLPLATCQLRAGLLLACSCCKWHDCSTLLQLLLLLLPLALHLPQLLLVSCCWLLAAHAPTGLHTAHL